MIFGVVHNTDMLAYMVNHYSLAHVPIHALVIALFCVSTPALSLVHCAMEVHAMTERWALRRRWGVRVCWYWRKSVGSEAQGAASESNLRSHCESSGWVRAEGRRPASWSLVPHTLIINAMNKRMIWMLLRYWRKLVCEIVRVLQNSYI